MPPSSCRALGPPHPVIPLISLGELLSREAVPGPPHASGTEPLAVGPGAEYLGYLFSIMVNFTSCEFSISTIFLSALFKGIKHIPVAEPPPPSISRTRFIFPNSSTQALSPTNTHSPSWAGPHFLPTAPRCPHPSCVCGSESSRLLPGWSHTGSVLCLAHFTGHDVLLGHPCRSLGRSSLPFHG